MNLAFVITSLVFTSVLRVYAAVEFIYYDWTHGLVFTYYGTRYCGPGTNVTAMDKLHGPLTEVDWACREHDLVYSEPYMYTLEELWEADDIFLERAKQSGSHWYSAFWRVFMTKRVWEKYIGQPYTTCKSSK